MDLGSLGEDSLKQFVQTLYNVLVTDKKRFELIVSAGNSGQIMVHITKIVYAFLKIPFPPHIVFPIYRYKDYPKKILFDNTTLLKDYADVQIPKNLKSVLFVDDEIDVGNAAKATLELICSLRKNTDSFTYTIIAEDGGSSLDNVQRKHIKLEYIAPKKKVEGVYNAVSYIIPYEFETPIQTVLKKEVTSWNDKQVMCILLQLPVKTLEQKNPIFSFHLEEIVKQQVPNLKQLQHDFQLYFTKKIHGIIENYSSTR